MEFNPVQISPELRARAAAIELIIFDVDGVLTDGSLFFGDDGQEYKAFNSRDGHGIAMLKQYGYQLAVITGRSSQVVLHRMDNLGVEHIYQGARDKLPPFEALLRDLGVAAAHCAYMGDDIVDLPVMRRAGMAVAVADAHALVRERAHWVTPSAGGRGAARDLAELLLAASGRLEQAYAHYLD